MVRVAYQERIAHMSTLLRGFDLHGSRYDYDEKRTAANGWVQIDTCQDAPYFGIWAHAANRRIATFCEGDLMVEICDDDADFQKSLQACLAFYDRDGRPTKIDAAFSEPVAAPYHALGFSDRIH